MAQQAMRLRKPQRGYRQTIATLLLVQFVMVAKLARNEILGVWIFFNRELEDDFGS